MDGLPAGFLPNFRLEREDEARREALIEHVHGRQARAS